MEKRLLRNLACRKGHLGGQKGQMGNVGSQDPKPAKIAAKRGKAMVKGSQKLGRPG